LILKSISVAQINCFPGKASGGYFDEKRRTEAGFVSLLMSFWRIVLRVLLSNNFFYSTFSQNTNDDVAFAPLVKQIH
jgi:hypothetical protein